MFAGKERTFAREEQSNGYRYASKDSVEGLQGRTEQNVCQKDRVECLLEGQSKISAKKDSVECLLGTQEGRSKRYARKDSVEGLLGRTEQNVCQELRKEEVKSMLGKIAQKVCWEGQSIIFAMKKEIKIFDKKYRVESLLKVMSRLLLARTQRRYNNRT